MMVQWNPNVAVGVAEIDEQHKEMIAMVDALYAAIQAHENATFSTLFDQLEKYAQVHFDTEERLMEQFGFPGLKHHRYEHQQFMKRAEGFKVLMNLKIDSSMLIRDILDSTKDWFEKHMLNADKQYGKFLNENGVD